MSLGLYGWLAICASTIVAIFFGILIWRNKETPTGGYLAFSVFAGIPIIVLSMPNIMPSLSQWKVETPDGNFSLIKSVKNLEGNYENN